MAGFFVKNPTGSNWKPTCTTIELDRIELAKIRLNDEPRHLTWLVFVLHRFSGTVLRAAVRLSLTSSEKCGRPIERKTSDPKSHTDSPTGPTDFARVVYGSRKR